MIATRIVIDMQPAFKASNEPSVIVGVTKEIIEAMRENATVMVVEYSGSGLTHRPILNLLKGYPHFVRVKKRNDGGAKEIIRAIKRRKIAYERFRVCGVNTDCCVMATVRGLLAQSTLAESKLELVKDACGTASYFNWRSRYKHPNLKVV
jgi:nicotinamidase-related amidase